MGEMITIQMTDGFELQAYKSIPDEEPKGCIVVLQEIFGVNPHIREVADGYASKGYTAVAPAIFDRVERDIQLAYTDSDMGRGIELAFQQLEMSQTLSDLQNVIKHASAYGPVGVVGYCFGGLLTYLCASNLSGVAAASSYYGGGIAGALDNLPKCPLIMHFGEYDAHIPMTDVEKIRRVNPDTPIYVYAADHGFNCDHRASFNAASAELAFDRTLVHFSENL